MSRGPGRIERAIRKLFDEHPNMAFVTDELVRHCYPDAVNIVDHTQQNRMVSTLRGAGNHVDDDLAEVLYPAVSITARKHRVAVLRAARNVIANDPDWASWKTGKQGGGLVFGNLADVQSYTLAGLMADWQYIYLSPARIARTENALMPMTTPLATRDDLMGLLDTHWVRAGIARRTLNVEQHCAKRDCDPARAKRAWDVYVATVTAEARATTVSDVKPDVGRQDNTYTIMDMPENERVPALEHALKRSMNVRDSFSEAAAALTGSHTIRMVAEGLHELAPEHYPPPPDEPAALALRLRALQRLNDPDAVRLGLASIAGELDYWTKLFVPP